MSGHLDGPPPGPPDPPYIPGDLGAPSAKEFARRRAGDRHMSDERKKVMLPWRKLAMSIAPDGAITPKYRCPDDRCGVDLTEWVASHPEDESQATNRCPVCLATVVAVSAGSDGEDRP